MAVNKILIDGVGIDLTNDTVVNKYILNGYTAHDKDGMIIEGTIPTYNGESKEVE